VRRRLRLAPSPLPLIPWREESPAFYVDDVPADDPVRSHFSWPNVYYAGAHEGCGCGFAYNQVPENLQEADEESRARASVAALKKYVSEAIARPVQLYACWEGEQSFPAKERVTASPDVLGGDSFKFVQLTLMEFPKVDPR